MRVASYSYEHGYLFTLSYIQVWSAVWKPAPLFHIYDKSIYMQETTLLYSLKKYNWISKALRSTVMHLLELLHNNSASLHTDAGA